MKILFLVPLFFLSLFSQELLSIDSTLHQIESLYNNARYIDAELEARRLSEEVIISDSVKVQVEKWIAFSLIAQGRTIPARERFVSLLSINPDFELDPVLTSPKILSVFNDAKVKYRSNKKFQSDSLKDERERIVQTITYRTALFPGWEQLHQGRMTSGSLFFGAGIATLGAGITFEILRANAREEYLKATIPSDIAAKYNSYNSYRKSEIYSFIGFAIVYFSSEIDVFTNNDSQSLSIMPSNDPLLGQSITLSVKF
ncbi:MAG: hypothetical protein AB1728_03900 [Bacteroidota bacterium]